jgi:cytochrome c
MFKQILVSMAVATMAMASPASPQQPPPTSEQAKRIEAMVNKAAALVESQGKAAFSEFRKRDSEWWFGNTYVFAYDQNLNVLLNPAFRSERGPIPMARKMPTARHFMMSF